MKNILSFLLNLHGLHLKMNNKAYTFDDILILPAYSEIEREDVDIRSYFHWFEVPIPIFSSPMDTISEIEMITEIYIAGGLGFHHRYCDLDEKQNIKKLREVSFLRPCGIAISPSMGIDAILSMSKDCVFVLDVAHGHHKRNLDFCSELIKNGIIVVSGNVATPDAINDYAMIGVRDFRIGIGSGSVCTTRTVAGVGFPQASAIRMLRKYFPVDEGITLISDGGHRTTGDIVKALTLGADFVMLGGMLAGLKEVPELGKKQYRGMASRDARNGIGKLDSIPEGITKSIKSKEDVSVADVLKEIEGAIKLACYYVGAKNLKELREKSEIIFVTDNSFREGLV